MTEWTQLLSVFPPTPRRGRTAQMGTLAASRCDSLCDGYGLSVADVAVPLAAVGHGVRILLALDTDGTVGRAEPGVGPNGPTTSWT